jgi:hypothetical protein
MEDLPVAGVAKQIGGRRERGVLCTRATEDADMRRATHVTGEA